MWGKKQQNENPETFAVTKPDEEWQKQLTPEQYYILREHGTERPRSSPLDKEYAPGTFFCAACRQALFTSAAKFDSGTGWPSFFAPRENAVATSEDRAFLMTRTEVHCARCGGHLGHVFPDGPKPTGLRYCINGAALHFEPEARAPGKDAPSDAGAAQPAADPAHRGDVKSQTLQSAIFAAGCFWGVEAEFRQIPGVIDAEVGYTGGHTAEPTYKQVCRGDTGHAEAVRVSFDPARVSYAQLLDAFWKMHDPTTLNAQGPDVGTQYRSAVFAVDASQAEAARAAKSALANSGKFKRPVVTEISAAGPFYRAEEYHQQYFAKRGIDPSCHRG